MLLLLQGSKAEAAPTSSPLMLQHQQPSPRRNLVVVDAIADVSAPPARCDVTLLQGSKAEAAPTSSPLLLQHQQSSRRRELAVVGAAVLCQRAVCTL
jgi:uncharacterized protein YcbX